MRLFVVLLATLAVSAQDRQVGQGVNFYSREKEAALGAQLAQEVYQRTTPLDSVMVRDFVEQIGRKLAAQLPDAVLAWSGEVLHVEEGALYPALHRLELRGLLVSTWGVSENNRRAKFYRLTVAGRKHLAAESSAWARLSGAIARVMEA